MKALKHYLFITAACIPFLTLAQESKLKCRSAQFAEHKNNNQEWNNLLDDACNQINNGKYQIALNIIEKALKIDSATSEVPDAFMESQYRKLKRHVEEFGPELKDEEISASNKNQDGDLSTTNDGIEASKAGNNQNTESKESSEKTLAEKEKTSDSNQKSINPVADYKQIDGDKPNNDSNNAEIKNLSDNPPVNNETENLIVEKKEEQSAVIIENKTASETQPVSFPVLENKQDNNDSIGEIKTDGPPTENKKENTITSNDITPQEPEATTQTISEPNNSTEKNSQPEELKPVNLTPGSGNSEVKNFTDTEMDDFHTKGMTKIKLLETYIQQVGSKLSASFISSQAIENALQLFDSEDRTVEVSSVNRPDKTVYKIKVYLNRLKILNYDEVDITWADFNYASRFIKGGDGKYHAYITFAQRFTGIKDGQVVYSDVTEKRQEVILQSYKKTIEGAETEMWDVLLGDMSVEHTRL